MDTVTIIFVSAIVLGLISNRITWLDPSSGAWAHAMMRVGLSIALIVVLVSLLVWGFASLSWYWPIIAFALGAVLCAVVVNRASLPTLHSVQSAIDVVAIGLGLYLWIWHWPF